VKGAAAIVPETKVTLKMAWSLATVATAAAVTGTLAWADVRHRLADVEHRQKALQVNVTEIGKKLGVVISWPLDEGGG